MEVDTYGDFADKDWKDNEKGFARMIQRIDESVGKIMDKLTELGIAENTLIIFSSDNGPHDEGGHSVTCFNSSGGFQGYKRSLHEGGIRIPFIAWQPGTIKPGESDHQGYFPDLLATFCDIAGVENIENSDGYSILPLLKGDESSLKKHDYLYFEFQGQIAVRKDNWKYFQDKEGNESLYNLASDKHEDNDLKEENKEKFEELKSYIKQEHRDYIAVEVPIYYDRSRRGTILKGVAF
jgi:arylsulfatase A-like enzyme